MGQVAGAATVEDAALTLNDLFSKENIGSTKDQVEKLRNYYPGLLHRKANAPGSPARQRTLRFAAWLLTSNVTFIDTDLSAKNFSTWLRWLTWLKKERPKAHNDIRNAIEENFAAATADLLPMKFIWTKAATEEDFSYTIKKVPRVNPDHYEISVTAKDGPNVTGADEDDPKTTLEC